MSHPRQANPEWAEAAFGFLAGLGYALDERWVTGGASFRDGWRLSYSNSEMRVVIQYLDAQLEVRFSRGPATATYLALDRELFHRHSGFHGDMFPADKLERALTLIAADVSAHYGRILSGDEQEWARIAHISQAGPRGVR